jgi:hypothetical protein
MHERRYTPARANPQTLEHFRIFIQQELDKIAQALMFEIPASTGGGGQAAVEFQDEGSALGTPGTVDTLDFAGAGVTAARVGNSVTVTIPGGTGLTHPQIMARTLGS